MENDRFIQILKILLLFFVGICSIWLLLFVPEGGANDAVRAIASVIAGMSFIGGIIEIMSL